MGQCLSWDPGFVEMVKVNSGVQECIVSMSKGKDANVCACLCVQLSDSSNQQPINKHSPFGKSPATDLPA